MKKLLLITSLILFTISVFSQRNISVIRVSTDTIKAFSATKTLSLKDTVKIDYADITYVTVEDSLIFTNGAGEGKVLTSDANGVASWNAFDFSKLCLPADTNETLLFFNGCVYIKTTDEAGTYTWDDANTVCQNKGVGCYLPSKMELDFIYQVWNQPANGGTYRGGVSPLTGFSYTSYWSSTVSIDTFAWIQYFNYGSQNYYNKITSFKVRCVRR